MSKHIVLITPKYDGREHAAHARSIRQAFKTAAAQGWKFDYIDGAGCPVLPRARNTLVAQALAIGADEIVFVDSDIAFSEEAFVRLMRDDCDLVGAAAQARLKHWAEGGQLCWRALPGGGVIDEATGLMEVGGLGAGFMRASRRVFEAIAAKGLAPAYLLKEAPRSCWKHLRQYFWYSLQPAYLDEDPAFAAAIQEEGIGPEQMFVDEGEDYYFCRLAREAGFRAYVDANIEVIHHEGRCILDLSLRKIEEMRAARAANEEERRRREQGESQ